MSLKEVIKAFKDAGLPVVRTRNKAPIINGWQKLADDNSLWCGNLTTATEAGFVITEDIVVIDVDPRNFPDGVDSLDLLEKELEFNLRAEASLSTSTASGGFHFYYKKHKDIKFPNELAKFKGIEFKQKGQQVILPLSTLPDGKKYSILSGSINPISFNKLPEKFYDVIQAKTSIKPIKEGSGFTNNTSDILRLKRLLEKTSPASQGEGGDRATYNVCCLGKDYGLSPDVFLEVLTEWNGRCSPPWALDELRSKVMNAYSYSHNAAGSNSVESMFSQLVVESPRVLSPDEAKIQEAETINWMDELQITKSGGYRTTLKNVVLFMKHDDNLKGKLAFNEFSYSKVWLEKPFWNDRRTNNWTDEDAVQIRYLLNNYNFDIGTNMIEEGATVVSSYAKFHPVRDWLNNLEPWDGVNRLDTLFIKYCGSEDNVYTRLLARKIFCGIIARIFNPGCKFDMIPIFVGEKGIRKSSLIEVFAIKTEWFCNNVGDITNPKELVPQANGKLIIEWQELSMYNKMDIDAVKGFASTQIDRVRRAHARNSEDYPRQFIVIATTNRDKFLLDETGERRITPIELKGVIPLNNEKMALDTDSIKSMINQLYAEALIYYKKGEALFIDDTEAQNILDNECEKRFKNDEIEETIVEWLDNIPTDMEHAFTKDKLQVNDILIYCFKETPAKSKGLANRIANVLRRLGYERKTYRTKDGKSRQGFVKNNLKNEK